MATTERMGVDPLAVIRAHAESHRSLAAADAYSAQEAPRLEAALAAAVELVEADRAYDLARAAYAAKAPSGIGESDSRTEDDYAPLAAAEKRRAAALAPFSEAGR